MIDFGIIALSASKLGDMKNVKLPRVGLHHATTTYKVKKTFERAKLCALLCMFLQD